MLGGHGTRASQVAFDGMGPTWSILVQHGIERYPNATHGVCAVHVSVCAHLCEHARRRGPNDCALGRFLLLEIQQKTRASARTRAICVLIAWSDVCARTRTHACACLPCLQHLERMARKQKTLLNAAAASMHV